MNLSETLNLLETVTGDLLTYAEATPADRRAQAPEGKWSLNQQLEHLIRSLEPLSGLFSRSGEELKHLFGEPNRPGRSYGQLVDRYLERLEENRGMPAPSRFAPGELASGQAEQLPDLYRSAHRTFMDAISAWDEEKVDAYLVPHPVLGKLTVREMLFFTCYHTIHHARLIRDYSA